VTKRDTDRLDSELHETSKPGEFQAGQEVQLVVKAQTDLGYKVIVNGTHWGLLYHNEIFQFLEKNQSLKGYVKPIREDGRLDVTLYQTGHHAGEEVVPTILRQLQDAGGFLPVTDKTAPEEIYERFGVSKKKFKIALGGLYKSRQIRIESDGIHLNSK